MAPIPANKADLPDCEPDRPADTTPDPAADPVARKAGLRSRLLAARAARSATEIASARGLIAAAVLEYLAASSPVPTCVAAYQPLRTEPGSTELLAAMFATGLRVLVPIVLDGGDLDWAQWQPAGALGSPLGVDAVTDADLVCVPALAVDPRGGRLGRGGGSYDRALTRVRPGTTVVALLYTDELLDTVPTQAWDRPMTAVVTPAGWRRLSADCGPRRGPTE